MNSNSWNSIIGCLLFGIFSLSFSITAEAVPRWAYTRGTISSCDLAGATSSAERALSRVKLPNVKKADKATVHGWNSDTMVLVFLINKGKSRDFIVVTTGENADAWRDKVSNELKSIQIIDCGPALNPVDE